MNFIRTSLFFESQRRNRWRWPWLLWGILLGSIGCLIACVGFCFALMILEKSMDLTWAGDLLKTESPTTPPQLALALLGVGIPFWIAAIVGTLIQGRSIRSLVSPLRPFRWGLAGKSVFLVSSLTIIIGAIPIPGITHLIPSLEFTGLTLDHAFWLVPLLLFTLVQTSGEDAFFKGYLLRQLGAVTRVSFIAPMVVAAVFFCLHVGNPDMTNNLWIHMPMFVVTELLAIYLLMRSGGMEIPLVLHWFNNVYICLFVAERGTQSNDLTLWVFERFEDEAINRSFDILSLVYSLISVGLLLLAFCWRRSPFYVPSMAEQEGADQSAAAPEAKHEGEANPEAESEARPQ
jgi:membrane protease YdiL (CAAX protease family)